MFPLFVNRKSNGHVEDSLQQEVTRFFALYLFTKRTCFYCWISYYFPIWNDRKKWTDNWIMSISSMFNNNTGEQPFEEKLKITSYVRKIMAQKHKTPDELKYIHQYQHNLEKNRQTCIENFEVLFRLVGFWEWLGLFDETTAVPIGFHTIEMLKGSEEDPLIQLLINEITDDGGLLMLNDDASTFYKAIEMDSAFENTEDDGKPGFYNMPLFSFPFCDNLAIDKIKALRASLQVKMQTTTEMTGKFIQEISKNEFNSAVFQQCNLFYSQLQSELPLLQQHIDDEIYFQQRKHSSDKYTQLTLNLCVTSIATIIDYYEFSKTLLPYAASALRRQLFADNRFEQMYAFS